MQRVMRNFGTIQMSEVPRASSIMPTITARIPRMPIRQLQYLTIQILLIGVFGRQLFVLEFHGEYDSNWRQRKLWDILLMVSWVGEK